MHTPRDMHIGQSPWPWIWKTASLSWASDTSWITQSCHHEPDIKAGHGVSWQNRKLDRDTAVPLNFSTAPRDPRIVLWLVGHPSAYLHARGIFEVLMLCFWCLQAISISWTIGYQARCATYLVGLTVMVVMTHALGCSKCGVWTKFELSDRVAAESVMPTTWNLKLHA